MGITLGEKLRQLRESHDMSLRQLAKHLGVSAAFLSDVELGRRHLAEKTLQMVSEYFRIPVEELKKYDSRPPVDEIRRQSEMNPSLGFAFRTAIENMKSGTLTPEELVRRLTKEGDRSS